MTGFRPRDVNIVGVCNSGGTITTVSTVLDSGLFVFQPTGAIVPGGTLPATLASITFVMGTANDICVVQPL